MKELCVLNIYSQSWSLGYHFADVSLGRYSYTIKMHAKKDELLLMWGFSFEILFYLKYL